MASYLVLLSYDPRMASSEAQMESMKKTLDSFTADTYCIASWMALGAGRVACLWEAPSEQSIIDAFARGLDIPVDGIYPASVVDWAETKKAMAGG
jgi:hypothetical protein